MTTYTFRRAQRSDLDAIKDIRTDIYEGMDSFPQMFLEYVGNPNRVIYVALHGERVVALVSWYIVDGGKTLVGEAFRRDTAYKNKFRATAFLEETIEEVKKEYPNLSISRGSSISPEFWYTSPDAAKHQVLLCRVIVEGMKDSSASRLSNRLTQERISQLAQSYPSLVRLLTATREDFHGILQDQRSAELLFPHRIVQLQSHPFSADSVNSGLIWNAAKDVFITKESTPSKLCDSLSISSVLPCQRGLLYEVNYYGNADVTTILAHVIKHVRRASQAKERRPLSFSVMLPREVASLATVAKIQDVCRELMGDDDTTGVTDVLAQIVLEMTDTFKPKL